MGVDCVCAHACPTSSMGRRQPSVGAGTIEFWASRTCRRSTTGTEQRGREAQLRSCVGRTLPATVSGLASFVLGWLERTCVWTNVDGLSREAAISSTRSRRHGLLSFLTSASTRRPLIPLPARPCLGVYTLSWQQTRRKKGERRNWEKVVFAVGAGKQCALPSLSCSEEWQSPAPLLM